ncbi:MAG: outer membrane protein assembly factor BamA [Exilispira sp.]|jgi:outer membrane protein insertion porin family|nr:outer membrane protein assembly factor BamA [Exilispira sp.]
MFFKSRKFFFFLLIILIFIFANINLYAQQSTSVEDFLGKKISKIIINGLNIVTKEEILFLLPVKVGDTLTYSGLNDIIPVLYKTEYFKSIKYELSFDVDDSVIITIDVVERELINKVQIEGNKALSKDKISEVLIVQPGDFISDTKLKKTIELIKNLYLNEGYEAPDIEYSIEKNQDSNSVNVILKITEKKRYIIKGIIFEGNKVFSEKEILKVIQTKKQFKFIFEFNKGVLNQGKLDEDLKSIAKLYYTKGYLDVEVTVKDIKVTETEKEKQLILIISIVEGEQYTLNSFTITGNKLFSLEEFLKAEYVSPNVIYNKVAIASLAEQIRQYYGNYGYVFANVDVEETIDYVNRKVDVIVTISENQRAHIEKIIVKGNTKTKDYVIIRELMIQEGETFSIDKIRQSIYNLYNTQYFSAVDVQFQPGSDDTLINLIIAVEEKNTGQFKFGATFSPGIENSFGLTGSIAEPNFLGLGLQISADLSIYLDNKYILTLSYLDKWFLGEPIQFGISLSGSVAQSSTYVDNDQNNEPDVDPEDTDTYLTMNYWQDKFGLSFTFGKRWRPYFSLIGYLSSNLVRYHSVDGVTDIPYVSEYAFKPFIEFANGNDNYWSYSSSISILAKYDTRDYYLFPTKGFFIKGMLGYYGGILFGDSQFIKLNLGFNINQSLFWKFVLSFNTSLDFIFPQLDGQIAIAPEDLLYINGYTDVRGWKIKMDPYYGKAKGVFSIELQREIITQMLSFASFIDVGYLLSSPSDLMLINPSNLFGTMGFGIKIQIPQLPLRLFLTHPFVITSSGQIDFLKTSFWYWDFTLTIGDIFTF